VPGSIGAMSLEGTALSGNSSRDLKRIAVRGLLWTGAGSLWRQLVQVATSLTLAHLLTPEIFGLLAMALVFTEVAQLFVDFGLGLAVVQTREPSPLLLSSCFWLGSGAATGAALLLSCAAPGIAAAFGDPRITPLVPFLAVNLVLSSPVTIPSSLLQRELRFAALAKITFVSAAIGSAVAVIMATAGFGIWSLIAQPLIGTVAMSVLVFTVSRWHPRWEFSWPSLQGVIRFGIGLFGSSLLNYCERNADNFLIGRFLGATSLGFYNMAYQLMLFPLGLVSSAVGKVTFPILADLRADLDQYRRFYLKTCSIIGFVTFPMMCGLFVVADQFVAVVLGNKWLSAITVIKILCPLGMVQSIVTTVGHIFNSTSRTSTAFRWTLVSTPITVLAFAVGLRWGIEGVAACYGAVSTGLFFFLFRVAFRIVGLRVRSLAAALWRPLACALLMAVVVFVVDRFALAGISSDPLRLGSDISLGAVTYLLLSAIFNNGDLREIIEQMRLVFPVPQWRPNLIRLPPSAKF
jgi:O-antigen/teichoic acid export membrane protein